MKTVSVFSLFILFQISLFSQNQQEIHSSFEQGDVETLSKFLDVNVDLTVLKEEGIYSKAQAKVILKAFFSANSGGTFVMQHQGGSENAQYVIGTLQKNEIKYRVYYLTKKSVNTTVIQKLRIEYD